MARNQERPDLDGRTIYFVISEEHDLHAGDSLIIRDIQRENGSLRISVVPEKAVREEAAKLFA